MSDLIQRINYHKKYNHLFVLHRGRVYTCKELILEYLYDNDNIILCVRKDALNRAEQYLTNKKFPVPFLEWEHNKNIVYVNISRSDFVNLAQFDVFFTFLQASKNVVDYDEYFDELDSRSAAYENMKKVYDHFLKDDNFNEVSDDDLLYEIEEGKNEEWGLISYYNKTK